MVTENGGWRKGVPRGSKALQNGKRRKKREIPKLKVVVDKEDAEFYGRVLKHMSRGCGSEKT